MAVVKKEVSVSKESSEVGACLCKIVAASKEAVKDGWQTGEDLPAIMLASSGPLMDAVQGMDKIGLEKDEDLSAFMNAWVLSGMEIAGLFFKKDHEANS